MKDIFLNKATSTFFDNAHKINTTSSRHELIYCLEGKYSYVINNCQYICRMNEFIVIPPNTDFFVFENEADSLHWQFDSTDIHIPFPIVPQSDNSVLSFRELLLLMLHEKENHDAYTEKCLTVYEKILLLRLMQLNERTYDAALNLSPQLTFIVSYLKEHYNENIDFPALFEKTGYSYNHMRHYFKNVLGISPKQYLTQIRFEQAQNLIANTDLPIEEIAAKCGFKSVSLFNYAYKRAFIDPPKDHNL